MQNPSLVRCTKPSSVLKSLVKDVFKRFLPSEGDLIFVDNLFTGIETSHFEDITRCVESLSDKKQIFITYLYAKEGARVSRYFNPAVIRQEIKVVKGDDGICRAEETK